MSADPCLFLETPCRCMPRWDFPGPWGGGFCEPDACPRGMEGYSDMVALLGHVPAAGTIVG